MPSFPRPVRTVRRLSTRIRRAWHAAVRARARRRPLWTDTVLYESFAGNGALDNPEAIFRELLDAPDQLHLRHVWVLTRGHAAFRREFGRHPRVRIVRYRSAAYLRALSRSRVLINNATFPPEFDTRAGQIYLNTWHGTPLKHMGYDMPDGALQSANVLRNLLLADVLLSQSPWMTERMYLDAYRLRGIHPGRILEVGYPRVDRQRVTPADRARVLAGLGVDIRTRLVVYAPTWTGARFGSPRDEAEALLTSVAGLQPRLGPEYTVLLKAHQSAHALVSRHPDAARVLVPNDLPTNVVLGVADRLVTDYSSIFFDALALDRPLTFFVPEPGRYRAERGAYVPDDELPGPVVHDLDALADAVRDTGDPFAERRRRWAERFTPHSDGDAAQRVIDAVFRATPGSQPAPSADGRRRILIYLGGMRSNGITSSALNLLRSLDHDALDVSVLLARPASRAQRANQALIDPRVRQFVRLGGMNASPWQLARLRMREHGRPDAGEVGLQARLYSEEWHRLTGGARFDAVADFSGYSRFWSQILLHSPAARRTVWLHNDMVSEVRRPIGARRRMQRSLPAMFALYPRFDALVSVSSALADLNRVALAPALRLSASAFVSARNLLDADRVLRGATVHPDELPEFAEDRRPAWLSSLGDPGTRWFVTVGRLSPEKNHVRLLRAFAAVHAARPDARLLLVGDGPERTRIEVSIVSLGLDGSVVLAGAVQNPFPLLAAAECFVLSSDYEGQPMVLLEAAALGRTIISTDFGSVRDALPAGAMTVVPRTSEGLADAMVAHLDGRLRPARIDPDRYNAAAASEVRRALLGPGSSIRPSSISAPTSASTIDAAQAVTPTAATTTAIPTLHMRSAFARGSENPLSPVRRRRAPSDG